MRNLLIKKFSLYFVCISSILFLFISCGMPATENAYPQEYANEVDYWAGAYRLDPNLIYAVIYTESGFDPNAQSDADAIGLMQMTSDTFDWVKSKIARNEPLVFEDLYTPEVSIRFGTYFMAYCMDKYAGDVPTAAAAYHSGMGTVDELLQDTQYTEDGVTLSEFPYPQMSNYVHKINENYTHYKELYPGTSSSSAAAA